MKEGGSLARLAATILPVLLAAMVSPARGSLTRDCNVQLWRDALDADTIVLAEVLPCEGQVPTPTIRLQIEKVFVGTVPSWGVLSIAVRSTDCSYLAQEGVRAVFVLSQSNGRWVFDGQVYLALPWSEAVAEGVGRLRGADFDEKLTLLWEWLDTDPHGPSYFVGEAFLRKSTASEVLPYYQSLLGSDSPAVITAVLDTLTHGHGVRWRAQASEDSRILFESLTPALVDLTQRKEVLMRRARRDLALTLAHMDPVPARAWVVDHFVSMLDDPWPHEALEYVARLRAHEALPALYAILEQETRDAVVSTSEVLIDIVGADRARDILESATEVNPNECARDALHEIIGRLERGREVTPR